MLTCVYCAKAPAPPESSARQAFVDDAGRQVLTECERCGEEKYIVEGQTVCDECKARPKCKRAK
jgi:hypothetical protein